MDTGISDLYKKIINDAIDEFKNGVMEKRKKLIDVIDNYDFPIELYNPVVIKFTVSSMNIYTFNSIFNMMLDNNIMYSSITFPKLSSYSKPVTCFITDDYFIQLDPPAIESGYWGIGEPSDYAFRHYIFENLFREQMYLDDFIFNK